MTFVDVVCGGCRQTVRADAVVETVNCPCGWTTPMDKKAAMAAINMNRERLSLGRVPPGNRVDRGSLQAPANTRESLAAKARCEVNEAYTAMRASPEFKAIEERLAEGMKLLGAQSPAGGVVRVHREDGSVHEWRRRDERLPIKAKDVVRVERQSQEPRPAYSLASKWEDLVIHRATAQVTAAIGSGKPLQVFSEVEAERLGGVARAVDELTTPEPLVNQDGSPWRGKGLCERLLADESRRTVALDDLADEGNAAGPTNAEAAKVFEEVSSAHQNGLVELARKVLQSAPYDSRTTALADECGRLRAENDELLRDNAKLAREVDKLRWRGKS